MKTDSEEKTLFSQSLLYLCILFSKIEGLMEFKDYYKILNVDKKASTEEIKKAYRKLAKQYHPDKNPDDKAAEDKFKDVSEAHEVLSNSEKRQKYDQLGQNWNRYQNTGAGAGPGSYNQWTGFGNENNQEGFSFTGSFEDLFNSTGSFSDLFESFMSGGFKSSGKTKKPKKGTDYEASLNISLEEAFSGTEKTFTLDGRTIKVKIQPGITDGQKLRLKNQGGVGTGDHRGDLYLKIHIETHPYFKLKNNDLFYNLNVDLYTAVLGGKTQVRTIDGKTINVNIPKGTDNGSLLRIKDMGMHDKNGYDRGDLIIIINVKLPKNLSPQEEKLFAELSNLRTN